MIQNSMSDDLGVILCVMSQENIAAYSSFLQCRRVVSMHLKNKTVTTRREEITRRHFSLMNSRREVEEEEEEEEGKQSR